MATTETRLLGPEIARAFVVGCVLGAIVVFAAYTAIAVAGGAKLVSAAGFGAFTAFWGGIGFGGMFGAVVGANRLEATERQARAAHSGAVLPGAG